METFLSNRSHPYVRIVLAGVDEDVELDCMIDTGFSGGISVPLALKDEFNFPRLGRRVWELADGNEVELEVFGGEVINDEEDNTYTLPAIFTDGNEGLVGIEFLQDKRLLLDLKDFYVELS